MYSRKNIYWFIACLFIAGGAFAFAMIGYSTESFSGYASVYDGKITASGEPFNRDALTAAHRTLPFGTRVKVARKDLSVVVTINDRGPFKHDRVIDLSPAAARALGFVGVEYIQAKVQ